MAYAPLGAMGISKYYYLFVARQYYLSVASSSRFLVAGYMSISILSY